MSHRMPFFVLAITACFVAGCGPTGPAPAVSEPSKTSTETSVAKSDAASTGETTPPKRTFAPVELGSRDSGGSLSNGGDSDAANQESAKTVREALKPLQIVVGGWDGNTFREHAVHMTDWLWDHRTDPKQPALVMQSEENPYVNEARLTWLPEQQKFRFVVLDAEHRERVLEGTFVEQPEEQFDDEGRPQKSFKIELEEVDPVDSKERWKVVFNQQAGDVQSPRTGAVQSLRHRLESAIGHVVRADRRGLRRAHLRRLTGPWYFAGQLQGADLLGVLLGLRSGIQ